MRFDERVRALNSISFAVMTVFASGISMNALAKLLHQLLGWNYDLSLWICSGIVLLYVLKGGLTSAIYTEVLQFFMIVLGFAPVVYLGLKDIGGWDALTRALQTVAHDPAALALKPEGTHYAANAWTSAWQPLLGGPAKNPLGVDWFAMVFGLGFVLSFGYWCTNFLVVQRAMAARNMAAARRTPLIAAIPKMLFPALVILPGMLAVGLAVLPGKSYHLPSPPVHAARMEAALAALNVPQAAPEAVIKAVGMKMDAAKVAALVTENSTHQLDAAVLRTRIQDAVAENDYDGVILSLVKRYCPPGMLGLALTALLASFMSGMAGNVTAFNTVWTYDLYQAYLAPNKSDEHYAWMGRAITVVGILLSIVAAYFASMWTNAMDIIQLVFGFVNAPLFATFLLGMFWARCTGTGAFIGLILGTGTSALFHAVTLSAGNVPGIKGGYLAQLATFPTDMAQNYWLAATAFTVCLLATTGISLATRQTKTVDELKGLVYSLTPRLKDDEQNFFLRPAVFGSLLIGACVILNVIFW